MKLPTSNIVHLVHTFVCMCVFLCMWICSSITGKKGDLVNNAFKVPPRSDAFPFPTFYLCWKTLGSLCIQFKAISKHTSCLTQSARYHYIKVEDMKDIQIALEVDLAWLGQRTTVKKRDGIQTDVNTQTISCVAFLYQIKVIEILYPFYLKDIQLNV